MHELSVVQDILSIALRHAHAQKAQRITDIHIVVGQWASIVDDSVQFYWDIVSQNTIAEGATLHFCRIAATMRCLDCNQTYTPGVDDLFCPSCHGRHTTLIQGSEFYLESIEIDHAPTTDMELL